MKKLIEMFKNIRKFISRLWENNGILKIVAFIAAFLTWFYIKSVVYPLDTKTFKGVIVENNYEATLTQSNLMLVGYTTQTVDIMLEGAASDLRFLSKDEIKAKIDLSLINTPGVYTLPILFEFGNNNVSIVNQSASEITVRVDKKIVSTVDVSVSIKGSIQDGYILDKPSLFPASLEISGPESIIRKIKSAVTQLDVSGISESIIKKSSYVFVDSDGNTIDSGDIYCEYNTISITADILKSKTVPLTVDIVNSSGGYDNKIVSVDIEPKNIIIAAKPSILDTIHSLKIGMIDICEISRNGQVFEIDITAPNDVKIYDAPNGNKATVDIRYPDIVTKVIKVDNFSFTSIPTGKTASPVSDYIYVTVRGLASDVNLLNSSNITAVIDLSDVSATGKIRKSVLFNLPEDVKAGVEGKYTALINIS